MSGPPIAILFPLLFGAGLATGLARFWAPLGAITILAAILLWKKQPRASLLAAAVTAGQLLALLTLKVERTRCTSTLQPGPLRLVVRTSEPADSTGGVIAVAPERARCAGAVLARWPTRQPIAAGDIVRVEGQWLTRPARNGRPGGILAIRRAVRIKSDPSLADRMHTATFHTIARLYGSRAPLVDALILGRRGGLDPDVQDAFAQSGLVHLLSISGFHVGLIVAWVVLLARLLRAGRRLSLAVGAGAASAYVTFLGWQPPAARAAILAWLLCYCVLRQRRVQANALLAQSALLVVFLDPWATLDLGGWLSVAALWGATTFSRWSDRAVGEAAWARLLASSIGATLATAPITAALLGTVAPIGIILNFAAIPLAAIAVPGLLASLLAAPVVGWLAGALAAGSGLCLHLLERLAAIGAAVPAGHLLTAAEPSAAIPWIGALALALWSLGQRNTLREAGRRWAWVGVAGAWIALAALAGPADGDDPSRLTLHFLDVGQGDAAVIRTPGGRWIVIDAGPAGHGMDAGRRVVVPFLRARGVRRLAALVLSHGHADHIGGAPAVLARFPADFVVEPGERVADPVYYGLLDAVAAAGVPWHAGRVGERFEVDGVRCTLIHPDPGWAQWGEDVNEDSLVLLVEYGAFQALFAGDAGLVAEARMRGRVGRVDVLKVGHHGSRGATGDAWLDELRPAAAIVSVGRNTYGHPAPAALARLAAHRVEVWRTDEQGTVTVATDGRTMTVQGRRGVEVRAVDR